MVPTTTTRRSTYAPIRDDLVADMATATQHTITIEILSPQSRTLFGEQFTATFGRVNRKFMEQGYHIAFANGITLLGFALYH
jgi:hypothetical protein